MIKRALATLSRWVSRLWPATLAGVLLGAAIGMMLHSADSAKEASAMIRVDQPIDPSQIMTKTEQSADLQQGYISGEIAYLTSPGFAQAVGTGLNQPSPPEVSANQNGQSTVITLSATGATFNDAQRTVNAAVKTYADHVQQQNRQRNQAAIDAITAVIGALQTGSSQDGTSDDPSDVQDGQKGLAVATGGAQQDPQHNQIGQLELDLTAIEVQAQRQPGVQVVSPPIETAQAIPSWSLGAAAGGLFGGLLALTGALAWRKHRGAKTSRAGLEDQSKQRAPVSPGPVRTVSVGDLAHQAGHIPNRGAPMPVKSPTNSKGFPRI
jgi:uncharacterized protein involved in exopolysaccharide biosynthesis